MGVKLALLIGICLILFGFIGGAIVSKYNPQGEVIYLLIYPGAILMSAAALFKTEEDG